MKSINKFFEVNEKWEKKFIKNEEFEHYGGPSFYNDGTYKEELYHIEIEKIVFKLTVKVTGRRRYCIYQSGKAFPIVYSASQKLLIDNLKKIEDELVPVSYSDFVCEECSASLWGIESEASGDDDGGRFSEYFCKECTHLNKIYDYKLENFQQSCFTNKN